MLEMVVDLGSFFEIGRYFGRSQVTGLARIGGRPIGVLANDPMHYGGAMGAKEARKFEKFVDLCDVFHLPIVNFADQPGFLIGRPGEGAGTLRAGVKAAAAINDSQVPWATVVVRRLYGVAGGAHQDFSRFCYRFAWPSGEWGSLPIEGGVAAAYRREIEAAEDPIAHRTAIEERLIALRDPFAAAEAFAVEDIVDPRETRPMLAEWLETAYETELPSQVGLRIRYGDASVARLLVLGSDQGDRFFDVAELEVTGSDRVSSENGRQAPVPTQRRFTRSWLSDPDCLDDQKRIVKLISQTQRDVQGQCSIAAAYAGDIYRSCVLRER